MKTSKELLRFVSIALTGAFLCSGVDCFALTLHSSLGGVALHSDGHFNASNQVTTTVAKVKGHWFTISDVWTDVMFPGGLLVNSTYLSNFHFATGGAADIGAGTNMGMFCTFPVTFQCHSGPGSNVVGVGGSFTMHMAQQTGGTWGTDYGTTGSCASAHTYNVTVTFNNSTGYGAYIQTASIPAYYAAQDAFTIALGGSGGGCGSGNYTLTENL